MTGSKELYDIFEIIYPIGIIIELTVATNPKDLFGIGQWEQIKDTFLLGAGDTYKAGNSGGNANTTLSTANMPAHTHTRGTMEITGGFKVDPAQAWCRVSGEGAFVEGYSTGAWATGNGSGDSVNTGVSFKASKTWTGATSSVGSGSSFSNMPPYYVVYRWKRVS